MVVTSYGGSIYMVVDYIKSYSYGDYIKKIVAVAQLNNEQTSSIMHSLSFSSYYGFEPTYLLVIQPAIK